MTQPNKIFFFHLIGKACCSLKKCPNILTFFRVCYADWRCSKSSHWTDTGDGCLRVSVAAYPSCQLFLMYWLHILLEQVGKAGKHFRWGRMGFYYFPPASTASDKTVSHPLKASTPFSTVWWSKCQAQKLVPLHSTSLAPRCGCNSSHTIPLPPLPTWSKGLQEFHV